MKSLNQKLKRVRPLLGTYVEIELCGNCSERRIHDWISAGFEAIADVDRLMSSFRADSDVSRLNRAKAGEWVKADPMTIKVLKASNELWKTSNGIFDVRCGGPAFPSDTIPVILQGVRARKTGPWTIDLGGIAKGFAVDHAVETLQQLSQGKLLGGVVNAGGDLRAWGKSSRSAAVRVDGKSEAWISRFQLRQGAMATSTVRRGGPVHARLSTAQHIQMPERKPLFEPKSVSVFAHRCLWSDALTKVVLMAGKAAARACLSSYRAHAIVFDKAGTPEVLS